MKSFYKSLIRDSEGLKQSCGRVDRVDWVNFQEVMIEIDRMGSEMQFEKRRKKRLIVSF